MALIIEFKVIPKSKEPKIILDKSKKIVAYVKSAPENNKANRELIKILSQKLKIPQLDILIISGQTSRNKKIKINRALTQEEVINMLGLKLN